MKNGNPVVWFEIYVDDLKRAKKFYETVFQLELNEMPMPDTADASMKMLFFPSNMEAKNSASGALVKMEGFKAGNNSTIVYFMSEDCSKEESRIAAAGGSISKSKTSLGDYGFMVLAADTEGNMIGVHSMK
ncbi:VOC family protein [Arenibacter sp. F26102]|uniref:VOC family protein n=1 Tax=Arenibacter sp. F26102 TaxID=2926416 RepID=UPI001FF583A9|nr:VOC family protein [Arenibacter sp. F26102]MCK0146558.1 VOC family protein [Arenibacter sp. F26102]